MSLLLNGQVDKLCLKNVLINVSLNLKVEPLGLQAHDVGPKIKGDLWECAFPNVKSMKGNGGMFACD